MHIVGIPTVTFNALPCPLNTFDKYFAILKVGNINMCMIKVISNSTKTVINKFSMIISF